MCLVVGPSSHKQFEFFEHVVTGGTEQVLYQHEHILFGDGITAEQLQSTSGGGCWLLLFKLFTDIYVCVLEEGVWEDML